MPGLSTDLGSTEDNRQDNQGDSPADGADQQCVFLGESDHPPKGGALVEDHVDADELLQYRQTDAG